jgi:hypothetical protein
MNTLAFGWLKTTCGMRWSYWPALTLPLARHGPVATLTRFHTGHMRRRLFGAGRLL